MPWIYLDDHIDEHPKVIAAGDAAFGFWVRMLAYCRRNLTAGRVPKSWGGLRGEKVKVRRLIDVGLVEENGSDSYVIHDYEEWNHSEQKSKKARDAARKRWSSRRTEDTNADADASPPDNANAPADAMQTHMPTQSERICQDDAHTRAGAQPLPLNPNPGTRSSSTDVGRAEPLPDDDDPPGERTAQPVGESGDADVGLAAGGVMAEDQAVHVGETNGVTLLGQPPSPVEKQHTLAEAADVLAEAWSLIADAELAARVAEKGPVGQPSEWLKRAMFWAGERHRDAAIALVAEHPDWPARRLAAELEPDRFRNDAAASQERYRAAARLWGARMAGVLTEDELVDDAQRHYAASPEAQIDALDAWRAETSKRVIQGVQ